MDINSLYQYCIYPAIILIVFAVCIAVDHKAMRGD